MLSKYKFFGKIIAYKKATIIKLYFLFCVAYSFFADCGGDNPRSEV